VHDESATHVTNFAARTTCDWTPASLTQQRTGRDLSRIRHASRYYVVTTLHFIWRSTLLASNRARKVSKRDHHLTASSLQRSRAVP